MGMSARQHALPLLLLATCRGAGATPDSLSLDGGEDAWQTPAASSPFPIDDYVLGQDRCDYGALLALFDGEDYLIVTANDPPLGSPAYIRAVRVTPSGDVVDPYGIKVSELGPLAMDGACLGATCLLAWVRPNDGHVVASRVVGGAIVDDPLVDLGPADMHVQVAGAGDAFLVVWTPFGDNQRAARITAGGELLDTPAVSLPTSAQAPIMAISGDTLGWIAFWQDASSLRALRISSDGNYGEPSDLPLSVGQDGSLQVASGPDIHLLVWQHDDGSIRAARINSAGALLDADSIIVSASGRAPSVTLDSSDTFLVASFAADRDAIEVARVLLGGTLVPTFASVEMSGAMPDGDPLPPVFSSSGDDLLLAWSAANRGRNELRYIEASRLTAQGDQLDVPPLFLSTAPPLQSSLATSTRLDGILVAWLDSRRENWRDGPLDAVDVYASRFGTDGATRLGPAFLVHENATHDVAVSSSPTGWIVAAGGAPATVTKLGVDGDIVATEVLPDAATEVAVASAEARSLVVWRTDAGSRGARLADGELVDPLGFEITDGSKDDYSLSVASDGTRFLVAWVDEGGVRSSFVAADGDPVVAAWEVADCGAIPFGVHSAAVASKPDGWFVGWSCYEDGSVRGALLEPGGARYASVLVAPSGVEPIAGPLDVSFDGRANVVAWQAEPIAADGAVRAAWVQPDGNVPIPGGILIHEHASWIGRPAVGCSLDDACIVATSAFLDGRFLRAVASTLATPSP